MVKNKLPKETLNTLFTYNPETGELYWKENDFLAKNANSRCAFKKAGSISKLGYFVVGINGKVYPIHSIAFCIHYGYWPIQIDHINRIRSDNRIVNLREANQAVNSRNLSKYKTNTSGFTGVCWKVNKWCARINYNGKLIHLGLFGTKEQAINRRLQAEIEFGYNNNNERSLQNV